jgi:hypothetical protein
MNKTLLGLIAFLLAALLFAVVGFGVYFATRPANPFLDALGKAADRARGEDDKIGLIKTHARALASACEQYHANNGHFPPSLESLTRPQPNGAAAFFGPDKLLDPWKKPYKYNPTGGKSGRGDGQPDVWAVMPSGAEVGNW